MSLHVPNSTFSISRAFPPLATTQNSPVGTPDSISGKLFQQKAALTSEERVFLRDFEVRVLLAKNAPGDRRYLRVVSEMIEDYMKKHEVLNFPPHMQKANDLIATLSSHQAIDLAHKVPKFTDEPETLSTNCFYHQLNDAVASANMQTEIPQILMAMRVVQHIIEDYLAPSKRKAFNEKELDKMTQITDKLDCFQKMYLTRHIPDIID